MFKGICQSDLRITNDLRQGRHRSLVPRHPRRLAVGDLLAPGFTSNYADRKLSWIYFFGTRDAATWVRRCRRGRGVHSLSMRRA
jgi:hypothetical protein